MEAVDGRRPLSVRMLNRYLGRLQATAVDDPRLTQRSVRVVAMIDLPSHLLHPTTIAPVLRTGCGIRARLSASVEGVPAPVRNPPGLSIRT